MPAQTRPDLRTRQSRLALLTSLTAAFFVLELVVGYVSNSVALVADAFHMLSDVLSLFIAWYAIKRAEILGALINGVALLALCFTIVIESIMRFYEPVHIRSPQYVLAVGCAGLTVNIFGLFLFHDHAHGHGGGHSHEHNHPHAHPSPNCHHTHSHSETSTRLKINDTKEDDNTPRDSCSFDAIGLDDERPTVLLPADLHMGIIDTADRMRVTFENAEFSRTSFEHDPLQVPDSTTDRSRTHDSASSCRIDSEHTHAHSTSLLTGNSDNSHSHDQQSDTSVRLLQHTSSSSFDNLLVPASNDDHHHNHHTHHHHGHGDLNMKGVFLHVLCDALGSVGVIISTLVILFAKGDWKYHLDPIMSIVITIIIVFSTIPLVRGASFILLQSAPASFEIETFRSSILSLDGVVGVHDLHVWQLSDAKMVASVHVVMVVDDMKSNSQSSRLSYMETAKRIKDAMHHHGIHDTTIQPEFITIETLASTVKIENTDEATEAKESENNIARRRMASALGIDDDHEMLIRVGNTCENNDTTNHVCFMP